MRSRSLHGRQAQTGALALVPQERRFNIRSCRRADNDWHQRAFTNPVKYLCVRDGDGLRSRCETRSSRRSNRSSELSLPMSIVPTEQV